MSLRGWPAGGLLRISRLVGLLVVLVGGCSFDGGGGSDPQPVQAGTEPQPAPAGPIRFGVLPAVAGQQAEIYRPFIAALGAAVERPVELWVASDYGELLAGLRSGRAALAQVSAYIYVAAAIERSKAGRAIHVLAQERSRPDAAYAGVFAVRADSPAQGLADLRDGPVAFVDRHSSSGYYYPRLRMRALGLDPDAFFGEVIFAGSHDAVIDALKSGRAAVGALSERSAALSGLRVIERTEAIPDDAIISLAGLTEGERARIREWLLSAHTQPALANFFIARNLERYVPAVVEVYDAQRQEMLRTDRPEP